MADKEAIFKNKAFSFIENRGAARLNQCWDCRMKTLMGITSMNVSLIPKRFTPVY